MSRKNICVFCKKSIIRTKIGDFYEPTFCVVDREIIEKGEKRVSSQEDSIYHFKCYKRKNWIEIDELVANSTKLENKR